MANVDLKTNFKNGDKLYDYELNNNFKAIQAALGAMNKIVWQNDDNASLVMFAGTTEQITNRELIEGQLLYNTQTGETYIDAMVDTELKRISTGGGTSIQIGGIEPTNSATKLWVEDDMLTSLGTEVINSLDGNETNLSPSVNAVNGALNSIIESGSNENGSYIKFADGTLICCKNYASTPTSLNLWGGSIYYTDIQMGVWALNFKILKNVQVSNTTAQYWCNVYDASETSAGNVRLIRPENNTVESNIHLFAIGRWK